MFLLYGLLVACSAWIAWFAGFWWVVWFDSSLLGCLLRRSYMNFGCCLFGVCCVLLVSVCVGFCVCG